MSANSSGASLETSPSEFIDRVIPELWSRRLGEPRTQTDLEFKCPDGNILAHKIFLKMFCLTLDKCLANIDQDQDEIMTVILPDVSIDIVTKFLKLVYTGSTCVSNNDEMNEINHFGAKILGFFMDMNLNISVESMTEEDRTRDSDTYSIEDCSVAPPICIYLGGEEEDSENESWQQEAPAAKRMKFDTDQNGSALIRCPECKESFVTTVKLHTHAVNCHYYTQLKTLLQPQYKMSRGFCGECQKPTASLQSFMYHMGVKHRVVLAVMTDEMAERYMSQIADDSIAEENDSFNNDLVHNDNVYCQPEEKNQATSGKINIVQCPQCSMFLENAQSLYAHTIGFHYYKRMATQLEPEFRRTSGKCIYCNEQNTTLSSYVHHLGYQHKLVHQFLPSHLISVYSDILAAEAVSGGIKARQRTPRNSKGTIPCPEADCSKLFDSISALYFHAAAIHYKKPLQEMYGEEFKRVKGVCTMCGSRLNSKQYYYIHMGSRHRVIQQLMDEDTLEKYSHFVK